MLLRPLEKINLINEEEGGRFLSTIKGLKNGIFLTKFCEQCNSRNGLRLRLMVLLIWTHAWVLDEIGKDGQGRKIEILIRALTMQEWGIRLILEEGKINLTHYSKEFVEY